MRRIKNNLFHLLSCFMSLIFKMQDNKVAFLSDVRTSMGGNLEFVYSYLDPSYEKVIMFKPYRGYSLSFRENILRLYHLSTSHYIILDDYSKSISLMKVRNGQQVCQLWHGPGAFKKFGYSRSDKKYKKNDPNGHLNYTKAFVTSERIRWCYAEGFGMKEENVLPYGMPRTDAFFDRNYVEAKKSELLNKYPEFQNKKIIIFAPTYRGVSLNTATYDFSKLDFELLYKELGDDYAFIIKWHPGLQTVIKKQNLILYDKEKYKNFIFDLSDYRDINDLLLISDILVTDYSSVIFDYALLNKPIIYYTYDLEEYEKDRGLYFSFQDYVYGEIVYDFYNLVKAIKKENLMDDKRKAFIKQFMEACDGNSTKRVVESILGEKE